MTLDVYGAPGDQSLATAVTDKNGSFVVIGLAPGTYRVRLSHVAYNTIVLTGVKITGTANERLRDPLAMHPTAGSSAARLSMCTNLVQPGQIADVYIVCTNGH